MPLGVFLHAALSWTSLASLAAAPADTRMGVVLFTHASPGVSQAAQQAVQDHLHLEVDKSRMFRWAGASPLVEDELLMALSCQSMDDTCLKRAAVHMQAAVVLAVDVAELGTALRVRLRVLHLLPVQSVHEVVLDLASLSRDGGRLGVAVGELLHRGVAGRLSITSQPGPAAVEIDGVSAGSTPLTVETLAPGHHHVRVTRAGLEDVEHEVLADPNVPSTLHAVLHAKPGLTPPEAPASAHPQPDAPRAAAEIPASGKPAAAYGLMGAGAAAGALALGAAVVGALAALTAGTLFLMAQTRHNPLLGHGLGTAIQLGVWGGGGGAAVLMPLGLVLLLGAGSLTAGGLAWWMVR